jgi:putative PIN family toxin of toxin-antitoxin system
MFRVVIDTNVFIAALLREGGAARGVIRLALSRNLQPVFGAALLGEYEDVLARAVLFERCALNSAEREAFFEALLAVSDWVRIHFLWCPNLPDEADNHVLELAVAAQARYIITENVRDFARGELLFPQMRVRTARSFLNEWRQA